MAIATITYDFNGNTGTYTTTVSVPDGDDRVEEFLKSYGLDRSREFGPRVTGPIDFTDKAAVAQAMADVFGHLIARQATGQRGQADEKGKPGRIDKPGFDD